MKNGWAYFLLLAACMLHFPLAGEPLKLSVGGEGVILINAKTGAVLYEKNAHEPIFPASTTKISTGLYVLSMCGHRLDEKAVATQECLASITPQAKKSSNYRSPPHWLETDGTHIGLKKGEEMTLYDLLHASLVGSANDASNVLAKHIGGTIPRFMEGVNSYLKKIGCQNTHFNNPHGLHHPNHVTTAYDLALMAKEAIKNPLFREIVAKVRYNCPQTNLEFERTLLQTNLLLRSGGSHYYPRAIGIKTGTTQAAGKNLVAAAEENGRVLIAVVMGHRGNRSDLYQDVVKLFDAAFNEPLMRRYLLPKGKQKMTKKVKGARGLLKTFLPDGLFYDFYPAEESPVSATVNWEIPALPIAVGQKVGTLRVVDQGGHSLKEIPLLAQESLKPTVWYKIRQISFEEIGGGAILFAIGAVFVGFILYAVRKRRVKARR